MMRTSGGCPVTIMSVNVGFAPNREGGGARGLPSHPTSRHQELAAVTDRSMVKGDHPWQS